MSFAWVVKIEDENSPTPIATSDLTACIVIDMPKKWDTRFQQSVEFKRIVKGLIIEDVATDNGSGSDNTGTGSGSDNTTDEELPPVIGGDENGGSGGGDDEVIDNGDEVIEDGDLG